MHFIQQHYLVPLVTVVLEFHHQLMVLQQLALVVVAVELSNLETQLERVVLAVEEMVDLTLLELQEQQILVAVAVEQEVLMVVELAVQELL
jgi:hypothetical protein